MTSTTDITIIGGGIIGLLTARELLLAGASVTVIEKNRVGQESSWAGGGILLPLYPWRQSDAITRLVVQSFKLYPILASQLTEETGLDPEWLPSGLLITKNPDLPAALNWCRTNAVRYEPAGPNFFDGIHTAPENPLWLPDIAQTRNPRLAKSLQKDIVLKGARIKENCEIQSLFLDKNRITGIETSCGRVAVDQLILSTGAWTGQLFRKLFPELNRSAPEISPVKGQMLLFEAHPDTLPYMVLDGDHYLIPRKDGKILAGSTVEQDDFNKTTSAEARERLAAFALNLLPVLKNFPVIGHWAGLRPGTEHGIPYIDRHPDIVNLSINAGHFRNGLAMGPASAELMADLILNRPSKVSPEPYRITSPH
ncbi:MAG: NAD(P)/FAD-dependent oxidoreductase [Gammaproteobacteria bacterium]